MRKRKDRPNFMYRKTLVQGPMGYVRPIEDVRPGECVVAIVGGDIFNPKPMCVRAVHDAGMKKCFRTCFSGQRVFKPGALGNAPGLGYKPDKDVDVLDGDGKWCRVMYWNVVLDHSPDLQILCHPDWRGKAAFQVRRMQDYFNAAWAIRNVYDGQDFLPSTGEKMIPLTGLRHLYGLELEDRNAFFLLQNGLVVGSV